ncbi:zinc-dependent alcohol dehydrogenase family protein [Desulfovibrio sp. Huiquan2017]|uniref:zinc-dependent alcohol dehydrogenase family protein n=1 Tax=Desulfovibrio sp. Huiquan2017 TaxID=2816861 RepID=UPI001A92B91E|nr:zinc-dependent alcohol dehydrogenase family protein [Desulfovibrio sp. Huiquan2017]
MRAMYYEAFGQTPVITNLADPAPDDGGVVVKVMASGLCRSDWHGWMGHDPDIALPHVPGHELAGVVVAAGKRVTRWKAGDRVTVPFVCGCGACPQCDSGNHQVCDHQFQPGFTHWGSFAEYVAIQYADVNLVRLPESLDYATAASLGCRFVTAFRAVVDQARTSAGQWVAVHGCGGVGLSAIMIANALGANVIGIDIGDDKLELAQQLGAVAVVNSTKVKDTVEAVVDISGGGTHVSIDALGNPTTCFNSIANLRKRGRHVQVGLMLGEHTSPQVPMSKVIANELEIYGSHGIQAHRYEAMWRMIEHGKLDPKKLVGKTITLEEGAGALTDMDNFTATGITVIDPNI